jgi:hypothetical protein
VAFALCSFSMLELRFESLHILCLVPWHSWALSDFKFLYFLCSFFTRRCEGLHASLSNPLSIIPWCGPSWGPFHFVRIQCFFCFWRHIFERS